MHNTPGQSSTRGLTRTEVVVVVVVMIIVALTLPNFRAVAEKSRRTRCMSNMCFLFKSASAWGLQPAATNRMMFPYSNLAMQVSQVDYAAILPEAFICPSSAEAFGKYPATNLMSIGVRNTSYNYFMGRDASDSGAILFCDMNGSNDVDVNPAAGRYGFGGNHTPENPEGGCYVVVAGSARWADATNFTKLAGRDSFVTNVGKLFWTNLDVVCVPAGNFNRP